jgi:hypothetical protein
MVPFYQKWGSKPDENWRELQDLRSSAFIGGFLSLA